MGRIRPLKSNDIPQVAELHERVIGTSAANTPVSLTDHFTRIFLHHPWNDESLPSLVYEGEDGRVAGCIGVMPMPMIFMGEKITAAISHNFIVEPGARSLMAGLELSRTFLAGPQELSLAEGNNLSRSICESFNGSVSLLYSLSWIKPIRPGRYLLLFLGKRGLPPLLRCFLQPFCSLSDNLAPLLLKGQFLHAAPDVESEELDPPSLARYRSELAGKTALRPDLDAESLTWLLETLEQRTDRGNLQKILVRDRNGRVIGWYIYYAHRGNVGHVVQVGAADDSAELILEHLFHHARQRGVAALTGQFDPAMFEGFCRKQCVFHHDGNSWMLVHTRHPEILQAINNGKACLSRLEGEWWINWTHA